MANLNNKVDGGIDGKYYVDTTCVFCELCVNLAPSIFSEHSSGVYAIVIRQPKSKAEISAANDAMEACPYQSIGNDE